MLNISPYHKEQIYIVANTGFQFMQIPFQVQFSVIIDTTKYTNQIVQKMGKT
jgi:hypothetical protein